MLCSLHNIQATGNTCTNHGECGLFFIFQTNGHNASHFPRPAAVGIGRGLVPPGLGRGLVPGIGRGIARGSTTTTPGQMQVLI